MTQQGSGDDAPKIIIDSDWKKDAAAEKERLEKELQDVGGHESLPEPSLMELVNMIVMQASLSLGGYKAPTGEIIPPDVELGKHYIDLLDLLKAKTAGNTTDEETKILESILHELRMHYVQLVSLPAAAGPRSVAAGAGDGGR